MSQTTLGSSSVKTDAERFLQAQAEFDEMLDADPREVENYHERHDRAEREFYAAQDALVRSILSLDVHIPRGRREGMFWFPRAALIDGNVFVAGAGTFGREAAEGQDPFKLEIAVIPADRVFAVSV